MADFQQGDLLKDYAFRELVLDYLSHFFGNGMSRSKAHKAICDYIAEKYHRNIYDVYLELHEAMEPAITNNIFESIGYPEGVIKLKVSERKRLIDAFCKKMEEIVPEVIKDMEIEYPEVK